jgi:hypothetical protein
MSDQDHAQTLRDALVGKLSDTMDPENAAALVNEFVRAAALARTCGTCRHLAPSPKKRGPDSILACWNTTAPTFDRFVTLDFGCTLHQPQEPPR